MPKIEIYEYDQTSAGFAASNNFSVVVPGFTNSNSNSTVFDENGVYECSDAAEFVEKVGKISMGEAGIAAKAAQPKILDATASAEADKYIKILTAEEYYRTYYDQVYTAEEITTESEQVVGKLKATIGSKWYKFTKATAWAEATKYAVILTGNEGNDATASTKIAQMGNQIAYTLLSLGYTVLYKNLGAPSIASAANLATDDFWAPLKDRSMYDYRYVVSGMLDNIGDTTMNSVINAMNKLVSDYNRNDIIILKDIAKSIYNGQTSAAAVAAIKGVSFASNGFDAYFAPVVFYDALAETAYNNNTEFPASMHYLACAAKSMQVNPEWYAVAGYNRGIADISLSGVDVKFGEAAVNELQPRVNGGIAVAVNLIAKFNNAYYMYGNRTGKALESAGLKASHFLNIRQLCCTLNKAIYSACKALMFDPNSDTLWLNFCGAVRPVLENMKANQGIKDYKFERKDTSVKGKLFAAVRIIPIEAVEDFEIGIVLEDNFDNPTVTINEHVDD